LFIDKMGRQEEAYHGQQLKVDNYYVH